MQGPGGGHLRLGLRHLRERDPEQPAEPATPLGAARVRERLSRVTRAGHSGLAIGPASASTASGSLVPLPIPLRSSARILRLWFKPWEDADRDLYDQGYVYVQIDSGQWLIEHAQRQIREAYAPLRPPPRGTAPATEVTRRTAPPRCHP
jgi:conjugal transfer pilus assembly protein TraV